MCQLTEQSFVFGVSVSGYNFIGRKDEIRSLKMNFEEGINTILISPRRWGKTSLVKRVCQEVDSEKVLTVFIDIFRCKTEYEFYNLLASEVLKQTATKAELWMENAKDFIARITPKISYKSSAGNEINISLGITPKTHTPDEVLELVEKIAKRLGKRIVVCIDEFQQIGEMADTLDIQKRLRSVWQHQKLTSYCLFGSKKHMMVNIFQKRNMPLYQFGDIRFLQLIPTAEWTEYIVSHFRQRNRFITSQHAEAICCAVENYSSYVQQLAWHVFSLLDEGETVTDGHVRRGIENLLDSQEHLFMQQIDNLTAYQMNFLRCIIDGVSEGYGDTEIRENYQLGSPSNITRLRTALIEKDLIESEQKKLHITDPVFRQWFLSRGL